MSEYDSALVIKKDVHLNPRTVRDTVALLDESVNPQLDAQPWIPL